MDLEFIKYEKRGRIAYVTIDRPRSLNALHPPASLEMHRVFLDFRDDTDVWIAVLTGSGERAFCAGNDLKYHAEHGAEGQAYPGAAKVPFGGITSDFECWKPIIAAVNGYAVGGGLEIALACDLIVADESAQLGAPEVNVGLVAAAGGVHRIPRQLPLKIGMGMLLTGKPISADEAHRWGLVNEVAPKGTGPRSGEPPGRRDRRRGAAVRARQQADGDDGAGDVPGRGNVGLLQRVRARRRLRGLRRGAQEPSPKSASRTGRASSQGYQKRILVRATWTRPSAPACEGL